MKINKILKLSIPLGLLVGVIAMLLQWIWTKIPSLTVIANFSTIELNLRQQITGGIGTDVGQGILNFLNMSVTLNQMLLILLSSVVIVFTGSILVSLLKIKAKNKKQGVWYTMLGGAVVFWLILVGFNVPALNAVVLVAVHYFIISWITVYAVDKIQFLKKNVPLN